MGLLSHRVERNEIAAGDHIYTWRSLFTYSHHGIYVGGNKVVHFTREQNIGSSEESARTSSVPTSSFPFSSSASVSKFPPTTCPNIADCGFRQREGGVILSCLDCFLSTGSLYLFEYGVSPSIYIAKVRGGCTTANSDPPQEVIHRAMHLLQNGFGNYDVIRNNCEDFALYCKTGLLIDGQTSQGRSGQAACVISVPVAAVTSFPLRLLMSPVGVVTATAGMYCMNRYGTDIGVRTDVVKVKVEDMVVLNGLYEPIEAMDDKLEPIEAAMEWMMKLLREIRFHSVSVNMDDKLEPLEAAMEWMMKLLRKIRFHSVSVNMDDKFEPIEAAMEWMMKLLREIRFHSLSVNMDDKLETIEVAMEWMMKLLREIRFHSVSVNMDDKRCVEAAMEWMMKLLREIR